MRNSVWRCRPLRIYTYCEGNEDYWTRMPIAKLKDSKISEKFWNHHSASLRPDVSSQSQTWCDRVAMSLQFMHTRKFCLHFTLCFFLLLVPVTFLTLSLNSSSNYSHCVFFFCLVVRCELIMESGHFLHLSLDHSLTAPNFISDLECHTTKYRWTLLPCSIKPWPCIFDYYNSALQVTKA